MKIVDLLVELGNDYLFVDVKDNGPTRIAVSNTRSEKMIMPYEEITSLIEEMKQTEDEIERLEQRKKKIGKNIAAAFAKHLNPVYRNWRPEIGERVVVADFRSSPPFLFEAVVRLVDGNFCKMNTTLEKTRNYLVLEMDEDLCNYDIPLLTFPMNEYMKLRQKVELPDFRPLM